MGASAWSWSLTGLYQSPHHIRPDCRQGELGALLFGQIEDTLSQLREYATVMSRGSHGSNPDHSLFVAKLTADGAQAQGTYVASFHWTVQFCLELYDLGVD